MSQDDWIRYVKRAQFPAATDAERNIIEQAFRICGSDPKGECFENINHVKQPGLAAMIYHNYLDVYGGIHPTGNRPNVVTFKIRGGDDQFYHMIVDNSLLYGLQQSQNAYQLPNQMQHQDYGYPNQMQYHDQYQYPYPNQNQMQNQTLYLQQNQMQTQNPYQYQNPNSNRLQNNNPNQMLYRNREQNQSFGVDYYQRVNNNDNGSSRANRKYSGGLKKKRKTRRKARATKKKRSRIRRRKSSNNHFAR